MPIQGFKQPTQEKGPTVRVSIQQPKDGFSGSRFLKENPIEKHLEGSAMWLLLGLGGLIFLAAKARPSNRIGSLNPKASSGIGDVARFKIDPDNSERVKATIQKFLDRAGNDMWLRQFTVALLEANGVKRDNPKAVAIYLHNFVNNSGEIPNKPDPAGYESIIAPEDLMARWTRGHATGPNGGADALKDISLDCDDKSLLLAALMRAAGIPSGVCLLDTDMDGIMDHAGTVVQVDGKIVFAETVVPGKQLGWKPPFKGQDCIVA